MRTSHGAPPLRVRSLTALLCAGALAAGGCTQPDEVNGPSGPGARPLAPPMEAAVPTSGLIGEWKMDEASGTTANDSKNNYDATLNGQAGFAAGQLGNALVLNNDQTGIGDDFATMPSNATLDNVQEGNYTLSAWFFPETVPLDQSQTNRYYAILAKDGQPMGLAYNQAKKFSMRHYFTGGVLQITQGDNTFSEGHWYHVAGVVNKTAGTIKVFVDGVLQATEAFTPGTAANEYGTTRFQVGKAGDKWAADGKVDQVRIYNRALTDTEVSDLAGESSAPAGRPLPVGVFGTTTIGNGPGEDATGPQWSVLYYPPSPSTISSDIDAADAKNVLLVLLMPANKGGYTNASGKFSLAMYKDQLDRWVTGKSNSRVDQATADKITDAMTRHRIVCYIIDEPNLNNFATPAQVDSMAREHKARWPTCLTFARITPTLLADGWGNPRTTTYPKLDYAWSQYNNNSARSNLTPPQVWAQERQAITSAGFNMGLAVSLNLWAGGNNQNTGGQQPCWDYAKNGTSSGYVLGDREGANEAHTVTCGNLGSPLPSVIASPNWIKYFAQQVAADGGFPFMLMWEAADASSSSDPFISYYGRSDFVSAFDNSIQTGQGAQAAAWRTPK
jgi:hypothetical protein